MNHFYLCSQREITCSDDYASICRLSWLSCVFVLPALSTEFESASWLNASTGLSFWLPNRRIRETEQVPLTQAVAVTHLWLHSAFTSGRCSTVSRFKWFQLRSRIDTVVDGHLKSKPEVTSRTCYLEENALWRKSFNNLKNPIAFCQWPPCTYPLFIFKLI